MPGGRRGFTLVELLAVMALIAIVGALSLPAFERGSRGIEARICRDQLARDLKMLRAEAVGRRAATSADFRAHSYSLDLGAGEPVIRRFPGGYALAGGGTERLVFSPDGRSDGGRLELVHAGRTMVLRVREDGTLAWE